LDEVLKNAARSDMPENFITQHELNSAPNLQTFLNDIIQPVRNRILHFPLSREEVTKNPFTALAMVNHILQFYEQVNIQLQQHVQPQQRPEQLQEQLAQPIQTEQPLEQLPAQAVQLVRPQEQTRQPQQPRLFSLFPNPSFKWRIVKVDGHNLFTLFPDTHLQEEENETNFAFAARCFFNSFNFTKLKHQKVIFKFTEE
jgi:cell envelope opacity-associated protein A